MKVYNRRDLTILEGFEDKNLVIACDSCGSVGNKISDELKVSPYYVGKFATRVCLTELLCSGSRPILLINNISCEMAPTGIEIINGIKDELNIAGFEKLPINGSTEENFKTFMTALGITVLGECGKNKLKFNKILKGDKIMLLGTPKVGNEIDLSDKGFYDEIKILLNSFAVKEIVPVGSKGIEYEVSNISEINKIGFKLFDLDIDFKKSSGPVSSILFFVEKNQKFFSVERFLNVKLIGEFV